jgi:RimJ/RimL family protein N-acetyltransferase
VLETPRLHIRPPVEEDREVFVALFRDPAFMVFGAGVLALDEAHRRFDRMLARAAEIPFAKQPVIERSTGALVGYSGVDRFPLEGTWWLEWGWRLVPGVRGRGYATEAGHALLGLAAQVFRGEVVAMIDPANAPSRRVADKLGFVSWKQAIVDGDVTDILRRQIG